MTMTSPQALLNDPLVQWMLPLFLAALLLEAGVSRRQGLGWYHFKDTIASLSMLCLLYTSPSPRDLSTSRMPSSA